MTSDTLDINQFTDIDAELCVRLATTMERRQPREREDQLIIIALRRLADQILRKP